MDLADVEPSLLLPSRRLVRHGLGSRAGIGFIAGGYVCTAEFGGGGDSFFVGASPWVSAALEIPLEGDTFLVAGLHSTPAFSYGGGVCHVILTPVAMPSLGVEVAVSSSVRVGAYGSFGLVALETGVRVIAVRGADGVQFRAAWLGGETWNVGVGYTHVWRRR